jgi:flagellar motor component MotA
MKHIGIAALGCGLILAATATAGAHLSSILQLTSFIIFGSITLGLSASVLGGRLWPALVYVTLRRGETDVKTLDTLERASFLGGLVGVAIGLVHALANFTRPELMGPGVAVALVCIVYSAVFNLILVIPAKIDVHSEATTSEPGIASRVGIGLMAVAFVLVGAHLEGAELAWFISYPALILVIGMPLLHLLLRRESGPLQLGNIALAAALVATVLHLINLMENLDKHAELGLRAARCLVPLLYGAVASSYFHLRIQPSGTSYVSNAAFAGSALGVVAVVVLFALRMQ